MNRRTIALALLTIGAALEFAAFYINSSLGALHQGFWDAGGCNRGSIPCLLRIYQFEIWCVGLGTAIIGDLICRKMKGTKLFNLTISALRICVAVGAVWGLFVRWWGFG